MGVVEIADISYYVQNLSKKAIFLIARPLVMIFSME